MRKLWMFMLPFLGLWGSGVPLVASDWPQHRGPNRHGVAEEPGLLASWEAGNPREVWRKAIGAGYSGVAVVGSRVFTMASTGEEERVLALSAETGELLWETPVGTSKTSDLGDTGPRSTPTVNDGVVYTASSAGLLVALAVEDGGLLWKREFGGTAPRFGYSVSPLIDGDLVIVESGAADSDPGVIALDKKTGELRWSALTGPAGYSSPIIAEIAGQPQYVFFRRVGNEVVSLSTAGEVLWRHPTTALAAITTPIFFPPDRIFVASADDAFGGAMLRITRDITRDITRKDDEWSAQEVWSDRLMRNHFNTAVLVGGHLYGFDNGTLRCLDAATGERRWAKRGLGKGSLIAAGESLFVLSDGGMAVLVEATPEGYRELGRTAAMTGRAWTPPSLANGRLYLRDFDEIVSLDVRTAIAPSPDPAGAETGESR